MWNSAEPCGFTPRLTDGYESVIGFLPQRRKDAKEELRISFASLRLCGKNLSRLLNKEKGKRPLPLAFQAKLIPPS
jgi:hypothetical protein